MTDPQTKWLIIGTLIFGFAVTELLLGQVLGFGIKPIAALCKRLPRRAQISLAALLLVTAAAAWVYGCSRPGFR